MALVTAPDPPEPTLRPDPSADRQRDELLHELSSLSLPLMWTLRKAAMRALEPLGLRPVKALVLGLVVEGSDSPKELSELLDTPPPMMSGLLADLEERGLIERTPDPDDRRRIRLAATDEGQSMAERITAYWIEAGRERFEGLDDDDLRHLIAIYRTFVETP